MGTDSQAFQHIPVMLQEVLDYLDPQPGEVVCDCTLGGAGHTVAMGKRIAPTGLSLGIDQDDFALKAASQRFQQELSEARYRFLKGNFGDLDQLLVEAEISGVDCFLFDIGVSSPQFDIADRGFSYHEEAPLDMRMDPQNNPLTAAQVVNTYSERDLARVFKIYGDERFASRIAQACVRRRQETPIQTTLELVECIKEGIPASARRHGGHPARKSFQALRIEVNHELDVLEEGLKAAIRWANPGGRIAVISYHSLEDRIVKNLFKEYSQGCTCPPDLPLCVCGQVPIIKVDTRKPVVATAEEIQENPRSRSAKLRVATKL